MSCPVRRCHQKSMSVGRARSEGKIDRKTTTASRVRWLMLSRRAAYVTSAQRKPHSARDCRNAARVLPAGDPSLMNRVVLLRIAQGCLAGLALGTLVVGSLPPGAYSKDLQQEYLPASAWRDGQSGFTPVTELSARYFPFVT